MVTCVSRRNPWIVFGVSVSLFVCGAVAGEGGDAEWEVIFSEDFSGEVIDSQKWKEIHLNDFHERKVDIVGYTNREGKADRRLRLMADTRLTETHTVKFQGIRTVQSVVDLTVPTEVSFDVDWNNQQNGCYLEAQVYVCPTVTDGSAQDEPNWLRMYYVGVPPATNGIGRGVVDKRVHKLLFYIHKEGWPSNRKGRKIGVQRVRMVFEPGGDLNVYENGELYHKTDKWGKRGGTEPPFEKAYLYVQMKSHCNYTARTLYFDNIVVKQKKAVEADAAVGEGDAQEDAGEKDTEPGRVGDEGVEQATEEVKEQQGGDAPQVAL